MGKNTHPQSADLQLEALEDLEMLVAASASHNPSMKPNMIRKGLAGPEVA